MASAARGRPLMAVAGALALHGQAAPYRGLNVPPQQGTSNAGSFLPGVYNYTYTEEMIANIKPSGFDALRLPVNVDTALDDASLEKLKSYVNAIGGQAVLCMFGTQPPGEKDPDSSHGTGVVDDLNASMAAWSKLHGEFASYPGVRYEIINEPFGYSDVAVYLSDIMSIIEGASLPRERCIIAGQGYASNVKAIADAGWEGDLAYHVYPNWLAEGSRTQEGFSNLLQQALSGLSGRVWVTEFGAALNVPVDYDMYDPSGSGASANVNMLRGLNDALNALRDAGAPVRGAFHWHGWHNADCYDFWDAGNANGAEKVRRIMRDLASADVASTVVV